MTTNNGNIDSAAPGTKITGLAANTPSKQTAADTAATTEPVTAAAQDASNIASASDLGVFATLRRGVQVTPQLVRGMWLTLVLAIIAAAGKISVPIAVQSAIDSGILAGGEIDTARVAVVCALAFAAVVIAGVCTSIMNVRLFKSAEDGLASLRQQAFSHIHRLTVLTQNTERRGSLVSRVTSDVDTVSLFVQWGGIMLLTSLLQIAAATLVMFFYSWQLALLVWLVFIPFVLLLQPFQQRVNKAYTVVRARMGTLLGAVSEAIVGAPTIAAYGVGPAMESRVNTAVRAHQRAAVRAMKNVAFTFSAGVFAANLVLVAVVIAGAYLGVGGQVTPGKLIAFLFLVQLFTGPVQMATEVLNEMQNAVAGWRRVLAILETPVDVVSPPVSPVTIPSGPAQLEVRGLNFSYPQGPRVLRDISLTIAAGQRVAVVGETGSGKTTLAKLAARFVDPDSGQILLDGVDLKDHSEQDLRRRVLLVPQEGFLFDDTLANNIAYGQGHNLSESERNALVQRAIVALSLEDWVAGFPLGIHSPVGQRGGLLSAGERQLVALARAYVTKADLLVMDEVTSAVDPATEVAIARALDSLMVGKSTITIAHRLSTAAASDQVIVLDHGRVVEHGPHGELVAQGGRYSRMFEAWLAQTAQEQRGSHQ